MVRSLFSGVAGLKTQQTKMDVIGNNIANVGTYGYKSSRATFKDVYYQTAQAAQGANGDTGGTNAIQIGYGNKVGSIDTNTATSAMSSTGYSLDVAITGDGYLQVMDEGGDIYYTKAGMLDIDSEGNLVDINGNFVLGVSGDSTQDPGSNKIKINLPYLDAASGKAEEDINGVHYTIDATNKTSKANVNFTFVSASSLPIGEPMRASISGSSIVVTVNANEEFASLDDFNKALNEAVTAANNGIEHPAGSFTLSMDDESKFRVKDDTATPPVMGMTGAEIVGTDFGYVDGTVTLPDDVNFMFDVENVLDGFTGDAATGNMVIELDGDSTATPPVAATKMTITMGDYSAVVNASQMKTAGSVLMMKGGTDRKDAFAISFPSLTSLTTHLGIDAGGTYTSTGTFSMEPSAPSTNLGLGANSFVLKGGTEGGEQGVEDLINISIGDTGILVGTHEVFGTLELGRIDLATFANPAGLAQSGNTYFETTFNSGDPIIKTPGDEGCGSLVSSTLESSNVDLSSEFTDMIMTQRGFQASSRVITVSDTMLEELINLKR